MRIRAFVAAALAGGAAAAVTAAARRSQAFDSWHRTSYSGTDVNLVEGLAAACGLGVGSLAIPGKARMGAMTAIVAASAAGAVDDHFEDRFPARGKGFAGHLGALRHGKVTSGVLKIGLIGMGAGLASLGIPRSGGRLGRTCEWVGHSMLVAGSANLVNLLDLRPGRALKASSLAVLPLVGTASAPSSLAGSVLGASTACLPDDLRGASMLGDLGANAVGAAAGFALASTRDPIVRWGALAGIVGLTLASEKVSFSKVIEETPMLAWFDRLGRA